MLKTAEELVQKLSHGGMIVSSNDLTYNEIIIAQGGCDGMEFWVDDAHFGYAYLPPGRLPAKMQPKPDDMTALRSEFEALHGLVNELQPEIERLAQEVAILKG